MSRWGGTGTDNNHKPGSNPRLIQGRDLNARGNNNMMSMKEILKAKVKKMSDEFIIQVMNAQKSKDDWKNWGDNELKIFAEEAFSRGLIK